MKVALFLITTILMWNSQARAVGLCGGLLVSNLFNLIEVSIIEEVISPGAAPRLVNAGSSGYIGGVNAILRTSVMLTDSVTGQVVFNKNFGNVPKHAIEVDVGPRGNTFSILLNSQALSVYELTKDGPIEIAALGSRYHRVLKGLNGKRTIRNIRWSPNGKRLAFGSVSDKTIDIARTNSFIEYSVYDSKLQESTILTFVPRPPGTYFIEEAVWSANSRFVAIRDPQPNREFPTGRVLVFDLRNLAFDESVYPEKTAIPAGSRGEIRSISNSGEVVFR